MKESIYKQILQKSDFAYSYRKIILDDNNKPADYQYLEVNPAYEKITGRKAETLIGKTFRQLTDTVTAEDLKRIAIYGETALKGTRQEFEYYSARTNRWYKIQLQAHDNHCFSALSEDISLQKQKERMHKNLSYLNSLAFKLSDLPVADKITPVTIPSIKNYTKAIFALYSAYDEKQKSLEIKTIDSDEQLLQKTVQIAGKKILNISSPVDDESYKIMLSEKIAFSNSFSEITFGAIPQRLNKILKKLSGVSNICAMVHVVSGRIYGTTVLGFNETQELPSKKLLASFSHLTALALRRKQTEQELKFKEKQFLKITENISDVVFTVNSKLKTTYITPSIEKLTGDSKETHLNKPLREKYPPAELIKFRKVLKEELKKEKDPETPKNRSRFIETQLLKSDGSSISVSMHLSILRNEEGRISGFLGVIRDITKTKQIEYQLTQYINELNRLNKDKDTFMSVLAHDLRSPFSGVLGLLELLLDNRKAMDEQSLDEQLFKIHKTLKSTYDLINDLLLWAKSQTDRLDFEPTTVRFSDLCSKVIDEAQPAAAAKNIDIRFNENETIHLTADENLVKFILRNLLSNAIKFSYKNSVVEIAAKKEKHLVLISVSDQGVGIATDETNKIWDSSKPYTTLGTDNEKGTGMGLILCKEFAEKHGGKIWAETNPDGGSKFVFSLPAA
jgi:PAS domain S-box-containing protein